MKALIQALNLEFDVIQQPVTVSLDGRRYNAMMFDINNMDKDEADDFLDDIFCDGMPDELSLKKYIPFLFSGFIEGDFSDGFSAIAQPEYLLFFDKEDTTKSMIPVYSIEIDGTAMEDTFKTMYDDVCELKVEPGHVNC